MYLRGCADRGAFHHGGCEHGGEKALMRGEKEVMWWACCAVGWRQRTSDEGPGFEPHHRRASVFLST